MILSILFFLTYFLVHAALLFRWSTYSNVVKPADTGLPYVTILLAVRNEENNLPRCFAAIENLDYPKDRLEVLIGEDNSTDNTFALVQQFIADKPNYRCIRIKENLGHARAKANVLAHLAREASSNYLFITDADIAVPRSWILTLLAPMMQDPKVGVVSGATTVEGNTIFEKIQTIDWAYSLGLIQVLSELPQPVSALGNNMLIKRDAYESVGGFETIPHSITEDDQIFQYLVKEGWNYRNLYQPDAHALSRPAPDFLTMLQQRKRWMTGSMHLPWFAVMVFVLHASFYIVLLTSIYYLSLKAMAMLGGAKFLLSVLLIRRSEKRLGLRDLLRYAPLFEVYLFLISSVLIPFYYLPIKINWKGRKYKK